MRNYDLVLVFKTSLSDDKRKKLVSTITSWVKDGKVAKTEEWGQKPLSYPIKKETAGFYQKLTIDSENSIPLDFEKRLLTQDDVLRHLLVRTK
ncbi:MAG: 30S ribosomal protein S6 [Candidatus Levybacteria bacterium]|nr:30S ribosomal protein S6 [Candidatus Levybacteria bacterium]